MLLASVLLVGVLHAAPQPGSPVPHVATVTNSHVVATSTTSKAAIPYWKRISNRYYDSRYERFRKCISKRESENIPTVVSHDGHFAQGLYQFEIKFWNTYLRTHLHIASTPYAHKPIHLWPASVQTAAFWLVLRKFGPSPWSGGRYDCTKYLP
jgi:hypothetical protein